MKSLEKDLQEVADLTGCKLIKPNKNPNRPKKGSSCKVDPIRSLKDIKKIKVLLKDEPRNLFLFVLGCNNGLRTGDLLKLKVKQVAHLKVGDSVAIKESKTGKQNYLVINSSVYKAMKNYFKNVELDPDGFLFPNGRGEAITIMAVNLLIKKWTKTIPGNYGCHSLRKTWGYQQRVTFQTPIEIITKRFNHANPTVTMLYLGLQDSEVKKACMNEI